MRLERLIELTKKIIAEDNKNYVNKEVEPEESHCYAHAVMDALNELHALRTRISKLNDPYIDPVTGIPHHQCSPYNVERLKHALEYHAARASELEKKIGPLITENK